MFYVKELEHEIVLVPIHFGPKLRSTIVRLLKEEVEGLALANYGYVVNVIEVKEEQIRSGIIEYESGDVVFYGQYCYYDPSSMKFWMRQFPFALLLWVSLPLWGR